MEDLGTPPATIVDARGVPREGAFRGSIPSATLERAAVPGLGLLGSLGAAGKLVRSFRRKRWRFAGVFRDDLVVAAALADVSYLGVAWAYVAEGDRVLECHWSAPGAVGIRVGPPDGASAGVAPGRLVSLAATREGGLTLSFDLPGIRADLDVGGEATPLTVVTDVGHGAGLHGLTVKTAGARARGTVSVEGRAYTLDDARAVTDWTEAFFPRRTAWFWATAAGVSADGRVVGFNLARGVHDDPQGRFTENALWLDGEPSALPPVEFRAGSEPTAPWTIRSADGSVDLVFRPRGERREDLNLVLVSSRYRQPFGSYTGKLGDARGREVRVEDVPGVAEDHAAVW